MLVNTTMEIVLAIVYLVLLLGAVEIGRWLAARHLNSGREQVMDTGAIQGAMLGLLALLLGFSFGGASDRFVERQDLVVADANAISTAWLRAGLLSDDDAQSLRSDLERYLEHRLKVSAERTALDPDQLAKTDGFHDRLWNGAVAAEAGNAELHVAALTSINELIDVFEQRIAAAQRHLPEAILLLLVICSLLTLLVIGYSGRMSGVKRTVLTRALAVLIALALLATVDMDHARIGLIQVSDAPLERLVDQRLAD